MKNKLNGTVFISYSSENSYEAKEVKDALEEIGLDGFLAHEDIKVSERWMDEVFGKIENSDIFIAVLSTEYKESEYCSQELGIALFLKKKIIPLSIDKTKSYGFLKIIQSDSLSLKEMQAAIVDFAPDDMTDYLITSLRTCRSFAMSDKVMGLLKPHLNKLSTRQANRLLEISFNNDQVLGSWYCQECLNIVYNLFKETADSNLIERMKNELKAVGKLDTTIFP